VSTRDKPHFADLAKAFPDLKSVAEKGYHGLLIWTSLETNHTQEGRMDS
jgi:hypothetical protein